MYKVAIVDDEPVIAVSYTHLDVYKRQGLYAGNASGADENGVRVYRNDSVQKGAGSLLAPFFILP